MARPQFPPTGEAPLLTTGPRRRGAAWGAAGSLPCSRGRSGGDAAPLRPRQPCGSEEGARSGQSQPLQDSAALPACRRARSAARCAESRGPRVARARMLRVKHRTLPGGSGWEGGPFALLGKGGDFLGRNRFFFSPAPLRQCLALPGALASTHSVQAEPQHLGENCTLEYFGVAFFSFGGFLFSFLVFLFF